MEHARAIRVAEDQLRSKPFSLCRSATPSANPFRFCRSKTTSYLHILQLLKIPWIQWFVGKSRLTLFVSADPQMQGEECALRSPGVGRAIPHVPTNVPSCISSFFTYLRKPPASKPTVFTYLRNNGGGGGAIPMIDSKHGAPQLSSLQPHPLLPRIRRGVY